MYKLLHIHSNVVFIDHSRRYVGNEQLQNEILFIGTKNEDTILKLKKYGITCRVFDSSKEDIGAIVDYANGFDGIIFHCLNAIAVRILLKADARIKTFLKFFGQELYMLKPDKFLSEQSWLYQQKNKKSLFRKLTTPLSFLKRKIKTAFNCEYFIQSDNQKRIFKRLDTVLMINKYEYDELRKHFYLPKLIERQLVDQEQEVDECRVSPDKLNKILVGNSSDRWNNHLDILEVIKTANNPENVEFSMFFSYGTNNLYSDAVRRRSDEIKNMSLIENFLDKEQFENIYFLAAALVINSYRQHAIGNIITGIKNGCKIYLNMRSSTFHWLRSLGFIISEVNDLKDDIENGNIRLSVEQQRHNFERFRSAVKAYTVKDFVNNVIQELNS